MQPDAEGGVVSNSGLLTRSIDFWSFAKLVKRDETVVQANTDDLDTRPSIFWFFTFGRS